MKLLLLLLIIEVVVQKCLSTCNGYFDGFNYTLVVERIYCSQLYLIISYRVPKNSTYVSIILEDAEYSVIGRSFDLNSTSSTANISFTELATSALLGTQQGVILICPVNLKNCFVPKFTSSAPLELLSTTKPSVTTNINSTFKIETEDQQWWFILLIVFPIFILLLIGLVVYFKHPAIAKLKFGCGKSCRLYETNSNKEENCKVSKSDNVISKQHETLVVNTSEPIKLFLIFVNEHKRHEKVIINFVNFLQADLGFEVICELFASEEISLDPVSWMERSLQQADKVIVVWSPGAAKRWKNENIEMKHDLFTPVLKQIRNDTFRDIDIRKYYFSYFDYCSEESIPKVFSEPKFFHFQLMQQFDELYFRLKGIEKYMPGGVITEDKVLFSRYFDPNLNVFGKELQQSIAEMNSFVKNNLDWHLSSNNDETDLCIHFLMSDNNNEKYEVQKNQLSILPPSPLHESSTKEQNDVSKAKIFVSENSNFDKLQIPYRNESKNDKFYESSDSHFNFDPEINDGVILKSKEYPNQNLILDVSVNGHEQTDNLFPVQINSYQDQEIQTYYSQLYSTSSLNDSSLAFQFEHDSELPSLDHSDVSFINTDVIGAAPDSPKTPVWLAPIDTDADPMNSLIMLNNFSVKMT